MYPQTNRIPKANTEKSAQEKARARVFCLCKDLGYSEEARREIAASFRADKLCSMKGMPYLELLRMEGWLIGELNRRKRDLQVLERQNRAERKRQHKRMDGDKNSTFASAEARGYMKFLATSYYGDGWEVRLHVLIQKMTGYTMFWYDEKFPKDLHGKVIEALKAMIRRAGKE